MILITQHELEDFCFCSLRYALGRTTYITNTISQLLIKYAIFLPNTVKRQLIKEIEGEIARGNGGMQCDIAEWQKLIEVLKNEI